MKSNCSKCFCNAGVMAVAVVLLAASSPLALAQSPVQPQAAAQLDELNDSVRELRQQVKLLLGALTEVKDEAARSRAETASLRQELHDTQKLLPPQVTSYTAALPEPTVPSQETATPQVTPAASSDERVARLNEEFDLLGGKVDELHQSKLESASKYRVRFSGIVLLNLASNQGFSDSIDVPTYAIRQAPGLPQDSFAATIRQSQLGFEVFGPKLLGARTSADLQLDFAGGFAYTGNGVNSGIVRLRTGKVRLDWDKTSLVAGQDGLFFAPQHPTSFASLAVPALSYAGNLWAWTPQVYLEHRFAISEASHLVVQGGILDNLTGEVPSVVNNRTAQAGEASRQPAYAARTAWMGRAFGQALTFGAATYFSPQNYGFGRTLNGWAVLSDWAVPLSHRLALTGRFYRGLAIGGIGGGLGRSVLFSGDPLPNTTQIRGLNATGGWSQLKFTATPTLEFNAAFGQDSSFARDLRFFPQPQAYLDPDLNRNREFLVNSIFRPRSDLLFSAEYRRIQTRYLNYNSQTGQFNLVVGVLF